MADPPRLVVSLTDDEIDPPERIVVTFPSDVSVRTASPPVRDLSSVDPKSSNHHFVVLAVIVILVLTLIGGAALVFVFRSPAKPNPATVPLPSHLSNIDAIRSYLSSTGSHLASFLVVAQSLHDEKTSAACRSFAIGTLNAVAPPSQMLNEANGIPDTQIRSLMINELDAIAQYINACANGKAFQTAQSNLDFTTVVALREFRMLHVALPQSDAQ